MQDVFNSFSVSSFSGKQWNNNLGRTDTMSYYRGKSISPGFTPSALASLRTVRKYGFCLPLSIWLTVSLPKPAFWASSPCVRNCLSRSSFRFGILQIFYHNATSITRLNCLLTVLLVWCRILVGYEINTNWWR